jgi:mono/diheme cytochrome c family protein
MRDGLKIAILSGAAVLLAACQGQMRDQISYRAMEAPLPAPSGNVAMSNVEVDLNYPPGDQGGPDNPRPVTAAVLALGKQKYESQCMPCHGLKGKGDGPVNNVLLVPAPEIADARVAAMSDGQIYLRIVQGGAAQGTLMPAFAKKLTVAERWAIVHYLKRQLAR